MGVGLMASVLFYPGDGSGPETVEVAYISVFPRDIRGRCAYCHGDPCAERSDENAPITLFYARNKAAESCPMCDGRPS